MGFSSYAIAEDYFFLSIDICSLNLAIMADYLLLDSDVSVGFGAVILLQLLHFKVFFLLFIDFLAL